MNRKWFFSFLFRGMFLFGCYDEIYILKISRIPVLLSLVTIPNDLMMMVVEVMGPPFNWVMCIVCSSGAVSAVGGQSRCLSLLNSVFWRVNNFEWRMRDRNPHIETQATKWALHPHKQSNTTVDVCITKQYVVMIMFNHFWLEKPCSTTDNETHLPKLCQRNRQCVVTN